jgi:hypothetical protein
MFMLNKNQPLAIGSIPRGQRPKTSIDSSVILSFYLPVDWERWLLGLIISLIWANGFKNAYHQYLWAYRWARICSGAQPHWKEDVLTAIERIRRQLEAERFAAGRSTLNITASFGISGLEGRAPAVQ